MIRLTRVLALLCALAAGSLSTARADNSTPPPVPVPTVPVVIATPVPASSPVIAPVSPEPVPTVAPPPTPAPEPVHVSKESGPVVSVSGPGTASETTPTPVVAPTMIVSGSSIPSSTPPPTSPGVSAATGITTSTSGLTLPPPSQPGSASASDLQSQASAQAPAQLSCTGKPRPASAPFMVAPYSGWADINSFLDHDLPDYAIDGKIIIANGLEADAAAGQESDFFPAYWSVDLRQFINYDGHNGYDFGISYAPVLAAAEGTITYAGWNGSSAGDGYGQMVLINHHNGYVTLYGHLSTLAVHTGDTVTAGQEIGISGSTGRSSGPHLHFSVFHNCQVTDPYGWSGRGDDPLKAFNGESSQYLWLPGHDPLVLNPPPNWPAYPRGLQVAPNARILLTGKRVQPAADRLLLLSFPRDTTSRRVPAAVALARTQALIATEGEAIRPLLNNLRAMGAVESYQFLPTVGAIWVRGTAPARTLLALPGVASLSGVQPRDLQNAQTDLTHGVLTQAGTQQPPTLWPAGFRSALSTWRPILTVMDGGTGITGVGEPGTTASITLLRHGHTVATARTTAEGESGGFVTTALDGAGHPISVQPGDTVLVRQHGREAAVDMSRIAVTVSTSRISGVAPPDCGLSLTATTVRGTVLWRDTVQSDPHGRFVHTLTSTLPPGSLVVASLTDSSGSAQSSVAVAPGISVNMGDDSLEAWGVPPHSTISITGSRHSLTRSVSPDAGGHLLMHLWSRRAPLLFAPGDLVSLRGITHGAVRLIPLGASFNHSTNLVSLSAPLGAHLLTDSGVMVRASATPLTLPPSSTSAALLVAPGFQEIASPPPGHFALDLGTHRLSGDAPPGTAVVLSIVRGPRHKTVHLLASSQGNGSRFVVTNHTFHPGDVIVARSNAVAQFTVPSVTITVPHSVHWVRIRTLGDALARIRILGLQKIPLHTFTLPVHGNVQQSLTPADVRGALKVQVVVTLPSGVVVTRSVSLAPGAPARR